jgi:hypothetical protein
MAKNFIRKATQHVTRRDKRGKSNIQRKAQGLVAYNTPPPLVPQQSQQQTEK